MRRYLQAIYNAPISALPLTTLKELGWEGIRMDLQLSSPEIVKAALWNADQAGVETLSIVRLEQLPWFPAGSHVELRNEPDLEFPNTAAYADEMRAAADLADAYGLRLWVGAISNPNKRGLAYFDAILPTLRDLPSTVGFTWHRYTADSGPGESFAAPHQGFDDRAAEVRHITRFIGDRPWAISEFGYHTAARKSCFRSKRWTDDQVATLVSQEFEFWTEMGASFATLYQVTDGPTDTRLDRYGICRFDGTLKPVADQR